MKFSNIKNIGWTMSFVALSLSLSCKKLVEVDAPANFVTSKSAFESNQTAVSELNAIYYAISVQFAGRYEFMDDLLRISASAGLSADEFNFLPSGIYTSNLDCYQNKLTSVTMKSNFWNTSYNYLFRLNSILEGLNKAVTIDENPSSMLSPNVKKQLLGEAKFMRAFIYFYLVNSYGDVPLVLTTDYKVNAAMPRTDKKLVYQQMEKDLSEAKALLNENYVNADVVTVSASSERTRPIKWAAVALLARVYLYMENYVAAEKEATLVIGSSHYSLVGLTNVFLKNSRETIFALQPVVEGYNSSFGRDFVLPATGPSDDQNDNPLFLNEDLVGSFEPGDPRRSNWIGSVTVSGKTYFYPFKYKKGNVFDATINKTTKTANMTEFNMVLRLAEQYLIRADARAKQGNVSGAIEDLNAIRARARIGYPITILPDLDVSSYNGNSILVAIENERRHELFTEWGDRWFNLRRSGRLDIIMQSATPRKGGGDWNPDRALYPISLETIRENPILTQNKGY